MIRLSGSRTTDVEIAGHAVPAGSLGDLLAPAANRDPALIDDPDTLDITRGTAGHVAFGHGVHHCLGAPPARMEMRIAFPALLRRFPRLALADPHEQAAPSPSRRPCRSSPRSWCGGWATDQRDTWPSARRWSC